MTKAQTTLYGPVTLSDWDGSDDPGEVDGALDQLADRLRGIEGPFDAYDGTGGQTVNGSASTVNIDTTRLNGNSTIFGLSSDVLTITQVNGGNLDISYRVTLGNTGTGDYGFDVYLEHAPASTGVFAEVAGSRVSGGKGT